MAKAFVKLMGLFGNAKHEFPIVTIPINSIIWDRDSQPLRECDVPINIISLPGHISDSIGFLTDNGELFCGDAAMNGFPSINRNIIWIEDLLNYNNSWDIMINSNAKKIYPAHEKPFPISDLIKFKRYLKNIVLR